MIVEPSKEVLAKLPKLYTTRETLLREKMIYLHFFIGGSDWYAVEFDGKDTFWGYVILNQDFQNSEWRSFSFQELRESNINGFQVDVDLFWKPCQAQEVDKIRKGRYLVSYDEQTSLFQKEAYS